MADPPFGVTSRPCEVSLKRTWESNAAMDEIPEIQTYVLKKQTDFLIFAAWLATAIWRFSPQERNRLAYLEIGTAESFTQLSHLLRLPGLAVEVPEALPSTEGELEDATVDSFIAVPEVYLDLLKDQVHRLKNGVQTFLEV
ncbi:unnamed protein product [Cladocopium goreaui]|uniref:Uncharacterized protein n=1 Tax=Cladocopium goreaui TaxID=2562237 RepID=A0A9P1GG67_9DINO|nr:unnamed protein product [Cladocopium goreaui]